MKYFLTVVDADFSANYDLLKIFIANSIEPDVGIPMLSDFRDWAYSEAGRLRSRKTAVLKKLFARKMQWVTEDGDWVDRIIDPEAGADEPEGAPSDGADGEDLRGCAAQCDLPPETLMSIMEMEIDDEDFAGPDAARSASQPLRVDPTSRGLQPGAKKPATYTGKANSKLKDQGLPDPTKRKVSPQLAEGYVSQIRLYQQPIETATEALDWKMISGSKDEATLEPLVRVLDKAIENYASALRPIKALFELSYASAQRVAHAAVEAQRGMIPIGIHGDDFRYTEHGQKLVLVSMNVLIDNEMQDKMNARLSIAHSDLMQWYWLNEFFNRMERNGRFLSPAGKAELEEACAYQEIVFMAIMDGTVVAHLGVP
ncbi:unnamed protein product [Symbiodinium microadriaticum]|nr:unnamed protein product [Symbiodinium microadriaticum]